MVLGNNRARTVAHCACIVGPETYVVGKVDHHVNIASRADQHGDVEVLGKGEMIE
jgi:hypothetical protein